MIHIKSIVLENVFVRHCIDSIASKLNQLNHKRSIENSDPMLCYIFLVLARLLSIAVLVLDRFSPILNQCGIDWAALSH